ncbi:MAG: potassium transporter TrkG [Candidatus Cryosericum sp.]|nr:Trk family potassium uptake protein [bacterium]
MLLSFIVIILVGTFLLLLPASSVDGQAGFLRSLFSAASATCVTGLVVVDTGTYWTLFGQIVILLLIQIGGLSYMVMTTMVISSFRRRARLSLRQAGDFRESVPIPLREDPAHFARLIALSVIVFEGLGALFLSLRFLRTMPVAKAVWNGIFTSVSAFCNAGFDVLGGGMTSFEPYVGDLTINLVVPALIIAGGIGFPVINELVDRLHQKQHRRLSTHARTALVMTALLILGGTVLIFALESITPTVFEHMSLKERLFSSWFQSVTARTAGFNTLHIRGMHPTSLMVLILLMFIGASPGGTGGGVKTTTFAVVAVFVWGVMFGSDQTHLGNRGITKGTVNKALVVFVLSLAIIIGGTFLLAMTDGAKFSTLDLLFEVTSAFGTVGLSTGITPMLSAGAKYVLILVMLAGRVGVLTATMTLLSPIQQREGPVRFAEDDVAIG